MSVLGFKLSRSAFRDDAALVQDDHYNITTDKILTDFIYEHRDLIRDYEYIKGTMDDVFLNLTGKELA